MKSLKKMVAALLCLCLCLGLTVAMADGYTATLKMQIATRTGPSTQYTEPGTFFQKDWQSQRVEVISKAYGSGVWWVQVEFRDGGKLYRAYTGEKRVNVNLDNIPQETVLGYGVLNAAGELYGYYGPGSHYAKTQHMVPWGVEGTLIAAENGYVQLDYYDSDLDEQCRAWLPSDLVDATWYGGVPADSIPENLAQIEPGAMYYETEDPNAFCQVTEYNRKGDYTVMNLYIPRAGYFSNVYVYMLGSDHGTFTLQNGAGGEVWFSTRNVAIDVYMPQYDVTSVLVFWR